MPINKISYNRQYVVVQQKKATFVCEKTIKMRKNFNFDYLKKTVCLEGRKTA